MSTRSGAVYRVNLKLGGERDADLIEWLESLPRGQRSQAMREALRAGLGRTPSAHDLESIREVVADELARALTDVHTAPRQGEENTREQAHLEARYGARLDRMLGSLATGSGEDAHEEE